MNSVNVHVDRVVVERGTGMPRERSAVAAALQAALAAELDGRVPADLSGAIERAARAAFAAPARGRG